MSQYDKKQVAVDFEIEDWVFVRYPQEESGRYRKLSCPWHGLYRIISIDHLNVSVVKVYFSQDPSLQVHLSRVQCWTSSLGYYWYGCDRLGRASAQTLTTDSKYSKRLIAANSPR